MIMHSTQALKVDQENAKAFYRRGLAQEALGKTQAAWGHGIKWDPTCLANEYGGLIRFDSYIHENIMGFSGIYLANIML